MARRVMALRTSRATTLMTIPPTIQMTTAITIFRPNGIR